MESKSLKVYTYVDGVNDIPFPNSDEQLILNEYSYTDYRMGIPVLNSSVEYPVCLDDMWTKKEYVDMNGERQWIKDTPTSSKNTDNLLYKHELQFKSERDILNHIYFEDVVTDGINVDRYVSNSTNISFYGDLAELAQRLNYCLSKRNIGYSVVVDSGISTLPMEVSFEDQYILDVLQSEYENLYNIPFYFVGKVIHFGFNGNAITYPFKYGADQALTSITKTNANYKIINFITGIGSSDNIPYYYPNLSPTGQAKAETDANNTVLTSIVTTNETLLNNKVNPLTGKKTVKLVSDVNNGEVAWRWYLSDGTYTLEHLSDFYLALPSGMNESDIVSGETINFTVDWIRPVANLMPSIFRESKGSESYYKALNNTYINPDTGLHYEFENQYTDATISQYKVPLPDIKPTIVGVTNAASQLISIFDDFAYDSDDNDDIDSDGNFIHPYFYAKLRKIDGTYGFNLFDSGIVGSNMTINFTSGNLSACKCEIGISYNEDTGVYSNPVQVDVNGNIVSGTYADKVKPSNIQSNQQNTINNAVWIALKKDNSTFGVVMPNSFNNYKPTAGDSFNITGINLPQPYILFAEDKVTKAIIKYMAENNAEKFNFACELSRVFAGENNSIVSQLDATASILLEYNNKQVTQYINSITYKIEKGVILPQITFDLSETVTVNKGTLESAMDSVKEDLFTSIGSVDFYKQGLKYFLRKDKEDIASKLINFLSGIIVNGDGFKVDRAGNVVTLDALIQGLATVNNLTVEHTADIMHGIIREYLTSDSFTSGYLGEGFKIWKDEAGLWHGEFDTVTVRKTFNVFSLVVQEIVHQGGMVIRSAAGGKLTNVTDGGSYWKCEHDSTDDFISGDQVLCQTFTGLNIKRYWRLVTSAGVGYFNLSKSDCESGSSNPEIGDNVAVLGNRTNTARQSAQIDCSIGVDAPYRDDYAGINSYSLVGKRISRTGNLSGITDPDFGALSESGMISENVYLKGVFRLMSGKNVETAISDAQNDAINAAKDYSDLKLQDYVDKTLYNQDIADLQSQIDGNITTWFYNYVPTVSNIPASNWTTTDLKNQHLGDLFYDTTTGYAYRYLLSGSTYQWQKITDTDVTKALADAANAQDTADGKRRVFVATPTVPYDVGDLWTQGTSGDLMRCSISRATGSYTASDWVKATKYTDDTAAQAAAQSAQDAQSDADRAQDTANNAIDAINNISSDNILSAAEKSGERSRWNDIAAEKSGINTQATNYGITTENTAYNTAFQNLANYLNNGVEWSSGIPSWLSDANLSANTTIVGSTYRTNWNNYFSARQTLLNAISAKAKALADANADNIDDLAYLKATLKEYTTISGGLIQSSVLALGYTNPSNIFTIMSGTSGLYDSNKQGGGIAGWYGGSMKDKVWYTPETMPLDVAKTLFRFDGSGYIGNLNIFQDTTWNSGVTLKSYAPPFSQVVFLRSATKPGIPSGGDYFGSIPTGWFSTIPSGTSPVWVAYRTFVYDAVSNITIPTPWHVGTGDINTAGTQMGTQLLYSTDEIAPTISGISNYPPSIPDGWTLWTQGASMTGAKWVAVRNVSATNSTSATLYQYGYTGYQKPIHYYLRNTNGVTITPEGHIIGKDYFLSANADDYISFFGGGFLGSGSSTGGGSSSSGTVTGIALNGSTYSPTDGLVTLPNYPTSLPASDVYSWAKQANKPTYAWDEIGAKPTTFTPSAHTHAWSDIVSGKPTTLSGYGITDAVTLDTSQPITGTKTFGDSCLQLLGSESNTIYHRDLNTNSSWATNQALRNTLVFPWYNNKIVIGNIRSGDTHSLGFGIGTYDGDFGGTVRPLFRVDDADAYVGNSQYRVLQAGNYNNYVPTLTGGGASGTWGINISGNSATSTLSASLYNSYHIDVNADNNKVDNTLTSWYAWSATTINTPHNRYTLGITQIAPDSNFGFQIAKDVWSAGLYHRDRTSGTWSNWRELAHIDDNVYSASKLQNTRYIFGQPFDGTGNVDGNLSIRADGGNYDDGIRVHAALNGWATIIFCGQDNTGDTGTSANSWGIFSSGTNDFYINRNGSSDHTGYELCNVGGNWGIGTTAPIYKLHVNGDIYATDVISSGATLRTAYGSDYNKKAIETRGNGNDVTAGIGFHQPGVVASTLYMDNSGHFHFGDNSGTAHEDVYARSYYANNDIVAGNTITAPVLGINNTSATSGYGLSLYGGAVTGKPTYGIMYAGTASYGTHGGVVGDWATYFTMSDTTNRGWIFQRGTTNVASIDVNGNMLLNGDFTVFSDVRRKDIQRNIIYSIDQIAKAPLFEYNYKGDSILRVGTSANYWADLSPAVRTQNGYYTLNESSLALACSISIAKEFDKFLEKYESKEEKQNKLIKEQGDRIIKLEQRIKELEYGI